MASTTSSNSGVHSESASSNSQPPIKEEQDVCSQSGETEKLKKEAVNNPSEDMDKMEKENEEKCQKNVENMEKENKEKYKKYAADYTRYLKAKYFSDKTIFGGNIYDVKMTSDDQTVKASRLPPYKSFADPAAFLAMVRADPKPEEENKAEASNGKQQTPKKSN